MRQIILRFATRPGLTRHDYWLAAGAADEGGDATG